MGKVFRKAHAVFRKPLYTGLFFALLILLRNIWLYWNYGYAYYPDSDLYVHSGASLFSSWIIPPVAMFPYPLLNAITRSSINPALLIWFQLIQGAAVGGLLVSIIARRNRIMALVTGLLLAIDLVWGAYSRAILTDAFFSNMHLLGIILLLWHYEKKGNISPIEAIAAGLFYGLTVCTRPSNIFLALLIPPAYFLITRSVKKTLLVTLGISIIFIAVGLINLKGAQKFYILAPTAGHGSDFIAFPLFVNHLFSPDNGPASRAIDQALQECYPGLNYAAAVDRSEGMAVDSVNNMNFILNRVIPCVETQKTDSQGQRSLFPAAYVEALTSHPVQFAAVAARETALFLRYGNAYVTNWLLNPADNYGCSNLAWCGEIKNSRSEWNNNAVATRLYQKASVKLHQVYLAPMGLLSKIFGGDGTLTVLFSWLSITALMLFFSKGYERLLFFAATTVIIYTAVFVVVGYGFTERYPSMLAPIQALYSALAWYALGRPIGWGWKRAAARLKGSSAKLLKHSTGNHR